MTADEFAARANRKKRRRWGCGYKAAIILGLAVLIAILIGGRR